MEQHSVKNRNWKSLAVAALFLAGAAGLIAHNAYTAHRQEQQKAAAERQFLSDMVAHEREAIALAALGEERGEAAEVKALARSIREQRTARAEQLRRWHKTWYGADPEAPGAGTSFRGVSSGSHLQAMSRLQTAESFDRVFLAVMVPHNEQAVYAAGRAGEEVLHQEVKDLALRITAEQQREIELMQSYIRSGFPSTFTTLPHPES